MNRRIEIGGFAQIIAKPNQHFWSAYTMPYRGVVKVIAYNEPKTIPFAFEETGKGFGRMTVQYSIFYQYKCEIWSYAKMLTGFGLLKGGMNIISLDDEHLVQIGPGQAKRILEREDSSGMLPEWHHKQHIKKRKPKPKERAEA